MEEQLKSGRQGVKRHRVDGTNILPKRSIEIVHSLPGKWASSTDPKLLGIPVVGISSDDDGGDEEEEDAVDFEDGINTEESSDSEDSEAEDSMSHDTQDSDDEDEVSSFMSPEDVKKMHRTCLRAASSLGTQANFYHRIGATIPDVPLESINKEDPTISLLCKTIMNRNALKLTPQDYHSCEIVLIPKIFDGPTKCFKKNFLVNFSHPQFQVKIFSDSSVTFGPCYYHESERLGDSSAVTSLVSKGWSAYFMDKSWGSGKCHQNNKDDALFDQMKGKTAGLIRKMRKRTPQVDKIEWINKSLNSKGCLLEFTEEDIVQACKVAMYDGIPEFIMQSREEDWTPYNPLARKDSLVRKSGEQPEDADELDDEEFAETTCNVTWNFSSSQTEFWKAKLSKKITTLEDILNTRVLAPKILVGVCIALNGPMRNRDVTAWLRDNFMITDKKSYERVVASNEKRENGNNLRMWFGNNANPHTAETIHFLNPRSHNFINTAIKKWRNKYGCLIQDKLTNTELWDKILMLQVNSAGLEKLKQQCKVTYQPPVGPVNRKYDKKNQDLKSLQLPLKYLLAIGLLHNGPMRKKRIVEWLSQNFDHLRHYAVSKKTGHNIVWLALKSKTWFQYNGKRRSNLSEWSATEDEKGDMIMEVRKWISSSTELIKEEARNKEILECILGF